MDDVLSATAKGDKKTIGEKFSPSYLDLEKASDGHYYTLTFGGGVLGVVYNKKLFKSSGITQLPRTTNELTTVCDRLNGKNIKPLCHFAPSGYWEFMDEVFFSQYDGFDYYLNNFYACKDTDGTSPSKALFLKKDGRMFFTVTRDGKPLRKRRYMFSESFYVVSMAEYGHAFGDHDALNKAEKCFEMMTMAC